jgi:phage terminase small subunit
MGLIEGYAKALERYFQADAQLRVTSMVTMEGKISPWYDIAERSLKQATQIGQLFGITPSARARIPQQQQPASKLEILKKKIS